MPTTHRSITCRQAGAAWNTANGQFYRIRLDIDAATGLSPKLFVFLLKPTDPYNDGRRAAFFSHVASIEDLETVPEDAPEPLARPAYFRLAFVDLLLQNRQDADDVALRVHEDLNTLLNTLDRADRLDAASTVEITHGELPEEPPGPSSSGSDSSAGGLAETVVVYTSPNTFAQTHADPTGRVWDNLAEPTPNVDGVSDTARGLLRTVIAPGESSPALLLQGFSDLVEIAENTHVTGIAAVLYASASLANVQVSLAQLFAGNRLIGRNTANPPAATPVGNLAAITLGGEANLWGARTVPATAFRGGEFGLLLVFRNNAATPVEVVVDGAVVTVHGYTT